MRGCNTKIVSCITPSPNLSPKGERSMKGMKSMKRGMSEPEARGPEDDHLRSPAGTRTVNRAPRMRPSGARRLEAEIAPP